MGKRARGGGRALLIAPGLERREEEEEEGSAVKHEIGGEGKRREGNEVLFLCVAKKRRCEVGKRKEEREYKGVGCQKASISAIAVVLLFRRNGGYCCESQKRGFRDRGRQNKIEEETQCFNSISRHKIWELLKRPFWGHTFTATLAPQAPSPLLRNVIFWNLGGGGNYFSCYSPPSISTLPCICTLCITAHNTLHRLPPPFSFRRRDFHESQTFVFCVPHCVTGGARRDGDPPIPPSPPFFPGDVAALAHFFTTKHALFSLIQKPQKTMLLFSGHFFLLL